MRDVSTPLVSLLGEEEASSCLAGVHTLVSGDSELAPLLAGLPAESAYSWLHAIIDHALGGPLPDLDQAGAAIATRLVVSPHLTARFIHYLSGTMAVLHGVSDATAIQLRDGLWETIRICAAAVGPRQPATDTPIPAQRTFRNQRRA